MCGRDWVCCAVTVGSDSEDDDNDEEEEDDEESLKKLRQKMCMHVYVCGTECVCIRYQEHMRDM